ncbi:hypothetical protein EDD22DRAFT_956453 [Suillus occidentalis]|nr:hypothetical protein EDD22DRAFT_956453 [Suillus occidentalis]
MRAIVHAAVENDVYEGYYIPKRAIVTPNVWYEYQSVCGLQLTPHIHVLILASCKTSFCHFTKDSDSDISLLGDVDRRGKGKAKCKATDKRKTFHVPEGEALAPASPVGKPGFPTGMSLHRKARLSYAYGL